MDKLVREFLESIRLMSYHNAAEGQMWFREEQLREKAYQRLMSVKQEMLKTYGRLYTQTIINNVEHLCPTELDLD
jgi:hypothetical protein